MLFYPLTPPKKLFNVQSLNSNIKLVHIGKYLRNYNYFFMLP